MIIVWNRTQCNPSCALLTSTRWPVTQMSRGRVPPARLSTRDAIPSLRTHAARFLLASFCEENVSEVKETGDGPSRRPDARLS